MTERILHVGANFFASKEMISTLSKVESDVAYNFKDAVRKMRVAPYSLVLLDTELSGEASEEFDALAESSASIVIGVEPKTAKSGEAYRLKRYDLVVCMPEEAAIVESVVRQTRPGTAVETSYALDSRQSCLRSNDGRKLELGKLEFLLLAEMAGAHERVHSVDQIIRLLVGENREYKGVAVLISRLQRKFQQVFPGEGLFKSVRNQGYCLVQKIELDPAHANAESRA